MPNNNKIFLYYLTIYGISAFVSKLTKVYLFMSENKKSILFVFVVSFEKVFSLEVKSSFLFYNRIFI